MQPPRQLTWWITTRSTTSSFTICCARFISSKKRKARCPPLAGVLVAVRSVRWGARHSLRDPLLWILHVGHAWIAVGLLLRALSALTAAVPASAATHALTVGAIGSMTLGMMARVALGHTGRMLTTPRPIAAAFALVVVSTVLRIFAAIAAPSQVGIALVASGVLWSVAFALYAIVFAPILFAPRVDLKEG